MREIRGCAVEGSLKEVRERKTPSAMVERQMLPRQTKRTETFLGEESVIVVVLLGLEVRFVEWFEARDCLCEDR